MHHELVGKNGARLINNSLVRNSATIKSSNQWTCNCFPQYLVISRWHLVLPKWNCFCFILRETLEFLRHHPLVKKPVLNIAPKYGTYFEKNQDSDYWMILYEAFPSSKCSSIRLTADWKESTPTRNIFLLTYDPAKHGASFGDTAVFI